MKKSLFVMTLCSIIFLIGCRTNEAPVPNVHINGLVTSTTQRDDEKNIFMNESPISQDFVDFIQSFSPNDLPKTYWEQIIPHDVVSPIQGFLIKPKDFIPLGYTGEVPWYEYENDSFYLLFFHNHPAGLFYTWGDLGKFWSLNADGFNDFYLLTDPYEERLLFKNFEKIIWTGISDYFPSRYNETVYTIRSSYEYDKETDKETTTSILEKNGLLLETITWGRFHFWLIMEDGSLLYEKILEESLDVPYGDVLVYLMIEKNGEVEVFDSWNGNFLIGNYQYKVNEQGDIIIGRGYQEWPNDIEEFVPTITEWILENIFQQEKTILKRYQLINQGEFDTAYEQIQNPNISFDEFVQQWWNYNIVSVESMRTPVIFFKEYGNSDRPYLENLGNYNQFSISIFTRDNEWNISYNSQWLKVIDNQRIIVENDFTEEGTSWAWEKEVSAKLYYHLIATHNFEEAYHMQYSHSQTLEQFRKNYEDVIGISFREYGEMVPVEYGRTSSDNQREGPVQMLIDFIGEENTERYYIEKEIIWGKVRHISSKLTTASCEICPAYGYKPVIYFYPEQEIDVKVYLPLKGEFIVTYPEISEQDTWEIVAQPDGTLINKADWREYSYLFREGQMQNLREITEGFVVKKEDTVEFLQEKLTYLGLTPKEYNEFIVYWWPLMMKNEWNLISFLGEEYTSQAPLYITPKPDSMQRVFMVFKWLEEPIVIKEQILKPFKRTRFSVIEWGGSEI